MRGNRARIRKPNLCKPLADLFKAERIAAIGIDQHVDGKDESADRTGSVRIHQELGNG